MNILSLVLAFGVFSTTVHAKVNFDRKENMRDLTLKTGKENDLRTYRVFTKKSLPFPATTVLKSVVDFESRCNNDYKNKREFLDQKTNCKFHQSNLIETFVVKDLNPGWLPDEGESERYLLGHRTYNRGVSSFYELVQIYHGQNKQGQKTYTVSQRMLTDKEVSSLTHAKMHKDSSFKESQVKFILTEMSPTETQLKYVYQASTQHWLLNKELLVPQVFSSITQSINDLVAAVTSGSENGSRSIASEHN